MDRPTDPGTLRRWLRAGFVVACLAASLAVAGVAQAQDPTPTPSVDAGGGAAGTSAEPSAGATPGTPASKIPRPSWGRSRNLAPS